MISFYVHYFNDHYYKHVYESIIKFVDLQLLIVNFYVDVWLIIIIIVYINQWFYFISGVNLLRYTYIKSAYWSEEVY